MKVKKILRDNRGFIVFLVLMFMVRGAVADWYHVPSGSMKPTIVEGDYVFVNKLAYDIHLPFSTRSVLKLADPQSGDVVVFESDAADLRLIKRVIAVPGDVISMRDKRVMINGEEMEYDFSEESELREKNHTLVIQELIENKPHWIQLNTQIPSLTGDFPSLTIPENNYFVLGDNRDNSRDSRYIGLVPRHEIVGRSRKILLSLNYDNYYLPRPNRFNYPLQ